MNRDTLKSIHTWRVAGFLAAIFLLAGFLRFSGLQWDEGQHLHPDERFLMMVVSSLDKPASISEYFDTEKSPLNPRNKGFSTFVYGTLPTTMLYFAGAFTGHSGYGDLLVVGRTLSALADMCTVILCFLLGWLVTKKREGGLLTAAFYGLAVLPIQHAHFFVADPFATLFAALSLTTLLWIQVRAAFYKWILAGAFLGAALACKLSIYTFVVIPLSLALWQSWEPGHGLRREDEPRLAAIERGLVRVGSFLLAGFIVCRVASPDIFRGPGFWGLIPDDRWLTSINEARSLVSGAIDFPPGHQWTARPRFWFPWYNMVLWGMGLPLGITAWTAFAVAAAKLLRGTRDRIFLITLWAGVLFLHQGSQWVMSLRYFLPIYPAMAALASWGLLELIKADAPRWRRHLGYSLTALVVGGTLLWALAFTAIYRSPHPRIEASRWILANIPQGSAIGNEVWDDALPLRVDGKDPYGNIYRGVEMHWYAEDDLTKLDQALQWLDETDYIVLSSNRLYDSIPRLWMRYPLTTRYYELLFNGELGFEPIAEFYSYPRLWGLEIPDTSAEEAFSVYDHPRVLIYGKTPLYNHEKIKRYFTEALRREPLRISPVQEARAPNGFRYSDTEWNFKNRNSQMIPVKSTESNISSTIRFFLWLFLLGPITAPIILVFARNLPDKGYCLARPLGLVFVGWLSWLLGALHIAMFTNTVIIGSIAALSAISFTLFIVKREEWRLILREQRYILLTGEAVFWIAFLAMTFLRWMNPDLWHPFLGGEKPMDVAYLNAVMRTPDFPPHSPWHAGSTLNYYYFGYVLAAIPIKLSGIATEVGYNLSIAGFFAIFVSAVFGVGTSLAGRASGLIRKTFAGLIAVAAAAIAGNLMQIKIVWQHITQGGIRPESWFWDASRVISHSPTEAGPITEFPWFTFLFADLHPHLMSLPFFTVLIGIAIAITRQRSNRVGLGFLAALVLGTLWVTNPWDLPTGTIILLFSFLFPKLREGRRDIAASVFLWIAVLFAARLLFLPFHSNYGNAYGSLELWNGSRTSLVEYFLMFGVFIIIMLGGFTVAYRSSIPIRREKQIFLSGFGIALLLAIAGYLLPAVLIMAFVFAVVMILRRLTPDDLLMPLFFTAAALGIGLMVEFLVLQGDVSRMNTVFKFYLQAWLLFAFASAAYVVLIDVKLKGAAQKMWRAVVIILGAIVLVYPMTATPARVKNRMVPTAPRTLDGLAFLENATFEINGVLIPLRDDLSGIRWLRRNATDLPVIAEATTHPQLYSWGARFSTHTGLPAIIGWDWHLKQQYAALPIDIVSSRVEDVKKLYNTPQLNEAWHILRRYDVEYIIVGALERALYDKVGIDKFNEGDGIWWNKVFESGSLVIYRVSNDPPLDK